MEPTDSPVAAHGGKPTRTRAERLSFAVFLVSIFVAGSLYGMLAAKARLFPYPQLRAAANQVEALKTRALERNETVALPDRPSYAVVPGAAPAAGLRLVVGVDETLVSFARAIDDGGNVVQEWRLNWFEIWPDAGYAPADRRPQSLPGELIHGAAILPDGDLVFNFEHLSTIRIDACGTLRWKLPNFAHHSMFVSDDGDIWVSAERGVTGSDAADTRYPHLRDYTIEKLSPDGEVLLERSVIDILAENDLTGLLHMSTTENRSVPVSGDTLHLNDVEVFPRSMPPGVFGPGDVLISLRNINTVMVLDPTLRTVKFAYSGEMLRQHDPDFASGNTITVLDNHNTTGSVLAEQPSRSRILEITAPSGTVRELFAGGPAFFTSIMGKHQILPNGDLLVTSAWQGEALEIGPDGRLVWELENHVGDGMRGVLSEVSLLPAGMDPAFFRAARAGCGSAS